MRIAASSGKSARPPRRWQGARDEVSAETGQRLDGVGSRFIGRERLGGELKTRVVLSEHPATVGCESDQMGRGFIERERLPDRAQEPAVPRLVSTGRRDLVAFLANVRGQAGQSLPVFVRSDPLTVQAADGDGATDEIGREDSDAIPERKRVVDVAGQRPHEIIGGFGGAHIVDHCQKQPDANLEIPELVGDLRICCGQFCCCAEPMRNAQNLGRPGQSAFGFAGSRCRELVDVLVPSTACGPAPYSERSGMGPSARSACGRGDEKERGLADRRLDVRRHDDIAEAAGRGNLEQPHARRAPSARWRTDSVRWGRSTRTNWPAAAGGNPSRTSSSVASTPLSS